MKESDIIHENGDYWVGREPKRGLFKVWQVRGCASYLCGTFAFSNDPAYARERAIQFCDRRAGEPLTAVAV